MGNRAESTSMGGNWLSDAVLGESASSLVPNSNCLGTNADFFVDLRSSANSSPGMEPTYSNRISSVREESEENKDDVSVVTAVRGVAACKVLALHRDEFGVVGVALAFVVLVGRMQDDDDALGKKEHRVSDPGGRDGISSRDMGDPNGDQIDLNCGEAGIPTADEPAGVIADSG